MSQGWPVGLVLGSESALLARYGVSRAVFREAVRLVEHQQVARMRRGPGGGLVVVEPSVGSIIDAVLVYLSRINAELDDVFDARMILEEMVAGLAPSRLDEGHRAELLALVERERRGEVVHHREMHALLAAATGNAALELFVDILNRVSKLYVDDPARAVAEVREASAHAHVRIAEAVMDGDGALARRRMHRHLEAEADWLRGLPASRQVLDPAACRSPAAATRAPRWWPARSSPRSCPTAGRWARSSGPRPS